MNDAEAAKNVCSVLESKLALFRRYLSVTESMKAALEENEESNLAGLILKRRDLIRQIEKIDLSMKRTVRAGLDRHHPKPAALKGSIEGYLNTIKHIMEAVEPLDRELTAVVKQNGEGLKSDLLGLRNVRHAAKNYGNGMGNPARFLDTRR